jgi:GTP diphosphokinase / guanosine-3',5'-bis(diphosphate) 3'-diphosphatase
MSQEMLIRAIRFAAQKHRDQRRKDASPYINHPIELVHILAIEAGIDDLVVLVAAALHDTVEDTETTEAELRAAFGDAVTDIVMEVTDDQTLERAERYKIALDKTRYYSKGAKLVRLADKISNIRDAIKTPPPAWSPINVAQHLDQALAIRTALRGTHAELERLFDESYTLRS